jgi:hypothetical protein
MLFFSVLLILSVNGKWRAKKVDENEDDLPITEDVKGKNYYFHYF